MTDAELLSQVEGEGVSPSIEPGAESSPSPTASIASSPGGIAHNETSHLLKSNFHQSYGTGALTNAVAVRTGSINSPVGSSCSSSPPPLVEHVELLSSSPSPSSEEDDEEAEAAASKRWLCFESNPLHGIIEAYMVLPR